MLTLISGKERRFLTRGAALAALTFVVGAANAQTSLVDPELYDLSTAYADFAARGSLEFNPPTRSNVKILGNSSGIADEPVRATNPWVSVLGQPQAFELNYNTNTGDLSWTLLGTTLTASYFLQSGYGLAYLQPSIKVQTPDGTAGDNTGLLSDLAVSVNGGAAQNYGPWSVSGTEFSSGVIYFNQYNIDTIKITGNITFDIPESWSSEINGTHADIELLSAQPVPEPASMAILGIGAMAVIRRVRKKK